MEYCDIPETVHEFSSGTTDENIPAVIGHGNTSCAKSRSEELDIKPEITVPSDCLTAVSMPKNWSQVERLKQQRLVLHQQLFSQKPNVKEEFKYVETVKGHIESKSVKLELEKGNENLLTAQTQSLDSPNLYRNSTLFDDETDTCSSDDDDDVPRLQIAESSSSSESNSLNCVVSQGAVYSDNISESNEMGQTENTNIKEPDLWSDNIKTESSCEEDENCSQKSLNSSDLCDLTASKINEALHNAIASVNVGKKQEKMRIKQVLEGLKMKAEEKESDSLGYRISKVSATAARPSTSSTSQSDASDKDVKEIKSESGLELQKEISDIAVLNPTRYVGLPINVDNVLKKFNYKNIALQKYLAEKRLKEHGADIVSENDKDSATKIQENAKLDEKPVKLKMSHSAESTKMENDQDIQSKKNQLNKNISAQRRQLEVERELCQIKQELYQKQLQVGPKSHDLKERILLAKQKMIKAKEKMLEAEIKLNEHKRRMVEKGIPLSIFPFLPCHLIGGSCNEDVTDSEDENCKIDIKSNSTETDIHVPICRKEPQMPVDKKSVKSSGDLPSVNDEVNNIKSKAILDQEITLETAASQRKTENSLENKPALKVSKATLPIEKNDLPVNGNSTKINVKSKVKKSVKRGKNTKTKCVTESRKINASPRISAVQTAVKTAGIVNSKDSVLNGIARNSPVSKNSSQCQSSQVEVIPQQNFQQNHTRSLQLVTSDGVQQPSLKCGHSGQTSPTEVILPSGFVKDEATNRTFHTYHFNGHTFVMIDNKLYQIHLKNTDGKTKSVIGTLIPTTASATTQLKHINTVSLQHSAFASVTNTTCSAPLVQNFTSANAKATKTSHNQITYRLPVNMIQSASQTRQPLNLLVITTTPACAATQSTQAIKKPLMNVVGGNNNVRAQLQRTFGQNTTSVDSSNCYQDANAIQLRLTPTRQNVFQPCIVGNFTAPACIKTTLTPLTLTHPVISQSVNQKAPYGNPTKCQQVNTGRNLSKNKTLVRMNTVPLNSTSEVTTQKVNKYTQHASELTPSEEYCTSVKISTGVTTSENQITNKLTFILPKSGPSDTHVVDTSQKVVSTDSDKLLQQSMNADVSRATECNSEKLLTELPTNSVLKNSKENIFKKVLNTEDSGQGSPAKICSSMDSFICTAKRKRKGTPFKKTPDKNIPFQPQKTTDSQLSPQSTSKEKNKDNSCSQKGKIEKKVDRNSEMLPDKVCGQIPFLDYPARIVTSNKTGSSSIMKEIVPSPKDKRKHEPNYNTSLNEEKIAKMISFANQLEAAKKKESVSEKSERKEAFKRRLIDSKSPEGICKKSKDTDLEKSAEIRNIFFGEGLKAENNPVKYLPLADEIENKVQHAAVYDGISSRNMFDKFEEIVYPKENFINESSKLELSDSYDSSDMENYEKVVADQKQKSAVMKPKSQLIESYYTSQGYGGMKKCQIEEQQSHRVAEPCVPSEGSPKNTDLLINAQKKPDFQKTNNDCLEIKQDTGKTKDDTISGSEQKADQNKSQVNQKALVTVGGRQVKKFIKTKFIILKGDICDRWFEIKKKTGFGEMSDPKFIHYLLRLEEERQAKISQIQEVQTNQGNIDTNGKLLTGKDNVVQEKPDRCSHDVDLNNNNNAYSFADETDSSSDIYDMEDTIVNVTDSPESSPRLSVSLREKCEHCSEENMAQDKQVTEASYQEKQGEGLLENFADLKQKSAEKTSQKYPRKRCAAKMEDSDIPAAKKQMSILSDATQRQMKWAVSLFREWIKEKGEEDLKFECREPAWLDEKLAMFYQDALSHKETPYTTDILQTFRRSLSLYLSSDSLSKNVHISIAQDPEYAKSNSVLSSLMLDETRWNISNVHGRVVHTITEEDMEKIYTTKTLSDDDPTHLLWKVWFDITYHLCKGKLPKNFWRSLSKHSLVLESDENGVFYEFADYVYLPPDEEPSKMYATPDNPDKCPVRSTSLYLSKLSGICNALFQCPKKSWNNHESWYWPVPMSREMLDSIISQISVHAELSKMYEVSSVIQTARRKSSEKL